MSRLPKKKTLLIGAGIFLTLLGASIISICLLRSRSALAAPSCVSSAGVSGYAEFLPSTITINPGQIKTITLRTYACNYSKYDVSHDWNIFSASSSVQNYAGPAPIDFSVSGLALWGGYYWVDLGHIAVGGWTYKDITVSLNGSAFGGDGDYNVQLPGGGIVYFTYPPKIVCGDKDGNYEGCPTNIATISLPIKINRGPYTIQGLARTGSSPKYNDAAMPNNCTKVHLNPPNTGSFINNVGYFFTGAYGSNTVSADIDVTCSGVQYKLVGYTLCTNAINCHDGGVSKGNSVRVAGIVNGYYDLWWHYTVVAPPEISCAGSGAVTVPEFPEPGQAITSLTVSFTNNAAGAFSSGSLKIEIPSHLNKDRVGYSPNPVPGNGGTATSDAINTLGSLPAGKYTVTWTLSGGGLSASKVCTDTITVGSKPYVKVFGNDIAAGAVFADKVHSPTNDPTDCRASKAVSENASFWAFDKKVIVGAKEYYGGSSSQFATISLGKNQNFFSAGSRNGLTPSPIPKNGLSFGNMISSSDGALGDYGGNSGMYRCIPDYFSARGGADNNPDGNVIINGGNPLLIDNESRRVIFVKGDAYIDNNITFRNTSWGSTNLIPSFYLIVEGNIFIDQKVTQLDGVYVAQVGDHYANDRYWGNIYTCTKNHSNIDINNLYSECQNQLTITGSFIADQVRYQRTRGDLGTVNLSIPDNTSSPYSVTNETPDTTHAAEVFNFSQEMYLATQPTILDSVIGGGHYSGRYDSITSLPPIL
ncbi:MAG: hypothetical protein WCJ24_02360 [Candidatus Saccharibacteria bacterium]